MQPSSLVESRTVRAIETLTGLYCPGRAGSGKTRVVTCRIANLISHGIDPSAILGLTLRIRRPGDERTRQKHDC